MKRRYKQRGRGNTHGEEKYTKQYVYGKGTETERRKGTYRREDIHGKKTYTKSSEGTHTKRGDTQRGGTHVEETTQ